MNKEKSVCEAVPNSDFPLIKSEIDYVNWIVAFACKLSNIKTKLYIDMDKLAYGLPGKTTPSKTHYEWVPFTPSGKPAKYPLVLHYSYKAPSNTSLLNECFGEIYYLQDGAIGKARLIFWNGRPGYFLYLGQTKNELVVKKVEKSGPTKAIVLYKEAL